MAFAFNGIGTRYYGQRDFEEDGTFVTTEWIVFLYVPVISLRSLRVRTHGSHGGGFVIFSWASARFSVYEITLPNWRQVLSVYAFLLGFALWIWGCVFFTEVFANLRLLLMPLLPLPFFVPYFLRGRAKRILYMNAMRRRDRHSASRNWGEGEFSGFIPTPRNRR